MANDFLNKPLSSAQLQDQIAQQQGQRVSQGLQDYRNLPASQTQFNFDGTEVGQAQAGLQGLNLGKILTGQDIYKTGEQVQDAIKRSQGLLTGDNPVTSEMTGQRNAAVARTGNEMAKAGIKGGAAAAAKLQVGSAMDKQIASQAYQQYTQNLQNNLKTLAGVQQAQITPMYTAQDMYLSANVPEYERSSGGILSGLFG